MSFIVSLVGSLVAVVIVYCIYVLVSFLLGTGYAKAELWWLPAWNSFRFVILNIGGKYELTDIRFRSWLRRTEGRREGCSVNTFVDSQLTSGERICLPKVNDLPLFCFRLDRVGSEYDFILTDKLGQAPSRNDIKDDSYKVLVEYSARVQLWHLFKFDITRMYALPCVTSEGRKYFGYLYSLQNGPERRAPVFLVGKVVRVTI